ncbi:hypothetical protein OHB49_43880 (plasmid) [Streptomyces sp. NBC_01717]|uniref:hypothetical protein n=1 Tax=Streptomyces sp. NBC_01717 TaxID=2975918 RepID=UPI002E35E745|nr:hypothetical protein [Streptomyces sp. NBC_01717]
MSVALLGAVWAAFLLYFVIRKGDGATNAFVYSVAMGGVAGRVQMLIASFADEGLADAVGLAPYVGLIALGVLPLAARKPDGWGTSTV